MIKSLYHIGKILEQDPNYAPYFVPWANPFPNAGQSDKATYVLFADITSHQPIPQKLEIEKFTKEKIGDYLYREAKGNATNLVPTFYFLISTKKEKAKWRGDQQAFVQKLIKKIKNSKKNQKHDFLTNPAIDAIEQLLMDKSETLNPFDNYLFTIKKEGKYLGEYTEYQALFWEEAYKKYYEKSSGKNQVCAITDQPTDIAWGRVGIFGFTVNDIAFSRNGFDGKQSYKMFPVSPAAVKVLESTRRLVMEKLTKNFFNLKYFVLPHFIIQPSQPRAQVFLDDFIHEFTTDNALGSQAYAIINNEQIFKKIVEKENLSGVEVYYDIFFFQQNQSQFLIKLHLSDVLPSRFRKILQTKESIEKKYNRLTTIKFYDKKEKKDKVVHYYLTFSNIKDYFSQKVKQDIIFHPYFFKVLEAVFYGHSLNREEVLKTFLSSIRTAFKQRNDNPFRFAQEVKQTFSLLQFFEHLQLFNNQSTVFMESLTDEKLALNREDFMAQHPHIFKDPEKKALFYFGCIVEKLLYVQRKYYNKLKDGQEPFNKHLQSLNFDFKQLRSLYNRFQEKVVQFSKEFHSKELDEINKLSAFLLGHLQNDATSLSRSDITYNFIWGMVMEKEFTKEAIRLHEAKKAKEEQEK